jgi:RNA-directed DNA polymerase
MLKTLETGMGEGKWFRLIDKVWSEKNLQSALEQVVYNGGSAGVDGRSVAAVGKQSEEEIAILHRQLRAENYEPAPVKRVWIPKQGSPEKRPLGVPIVRDRIMQTALRNVIEPIFERDFAPQSYGFRPGRGCKDALRRVDELLKEGGVWVVDADIKGYFDTIPHGPLMERVGRKIADGRVLRLIEGYLKAGVMESVKGWQPTERGTPQGAVISPLLANIYLDPLDWEMAQGSQEMVRYADDFVVLCHSEEEAQQALGRIQDFAKANGLTLHPEKTRIVDARKPGGFDFLGYHFERGMKWPRKKSMAKLKEGLRAKTRRTNGQSMTAICHELNGLLQAPRRQRPGPGQRSSVLVQRLLLRPRLDLPESMSAGDPSISVRSTHQLESRMREIRLSGSGEGAVHPVPISSTKSNPCQRPLGTAAFSEIINLA